MDPRISVSQITILFLYCVTAAAFAISRLPKHSARSTTLVPFAFILGILGVLVHARLLYFGVVAGGNLTLETAISLIGLQLGLIAMIAALNASLRGVSAALLLLAALTALANGYVANDGAASDIGWQLRSHVLTSMFAYGLLTAGAIIALFALVQERRLKSAKISAINHLFAPLETSEKLLFAVTLAGFTVLALSIVTGVTFVEDLFAQHLVHKSLLSIMALVLFGVLLLARQFVGLRGRKAIFLYLASFAILSLAYFGSRYILEEILGRSWS